jgi:hypothetical protein
MKVQNTKYIKLVIILFLSACYTAYGKSSSDTSDKGIQFVTGLT